MKKLIVILLGLISTGAFAQRSNIESAVIYLRNLEMDEAKKAIDDAAVHNDTKDDPKMWSVRAAVYDTMSHNPEFYKYDTLRDEKYVVACLKCMETDVKKRFEDYCGTAIINAGISAYNLAVDNHGKVKGDHPDPYYLNNAIKYYKYVQQVLPYDKDGLLKKNNITEKLITKYTGDLCFTAKEYKAAIAQYEKLIKMGYIEAGVYRFMAFSYILIGDTAGAMNIISEGRTAFKTDQDLINMELNIYMKQGKQQELLNKLTDAIALDEENADLLFVRGNIYDRLAEECSNTGRDLRDTVAKMTKRSKNEKVPVTKMKLDNAIKSLSKAADSLFATQKLFLSKSEKDYLKVIEVKPDHLDALFNLGALNNNRTTDLVDKMNSLTAATQTEYDKKWGAMNRTKDSILTQSVGYFMKALDIAETLPESDDASLAKKKDTLISIYRSLQFVYAGMNDEKKTMEMMQKRKELEK